MIKAWLRTISFWVLLIGFGLGATVLATQLVPRLFSIGAGYTVALPIIAIAAGLVALIIWGLDRSHAQVRSAWALAFVWGAIGACGLALHINGLASDAVNDLLGDPGSTTWGAAIVGSLDEETIKGAGVALILVLYRDTVRRPLQAFAVGAFAGLGFQVLENVTYAINFALRDAQSDEVGAVTVAIMRALFGFQSHWVYTGFFAVGLILLRSRRLLALAPIALAYGMHFWWNAPGGDNPLIAFGLILLKCAVTVCLLAGLWSWMIFEQRAWLRSAIATPDAAALAPPGELATLPTRALRTSGLNYVRYYYGPAVAAVAKQRQTWLLRELTTRVGSIAPRAQAPEQPPRVS